MLRVAACGDDAGFLDELTGFIRAYFRENDREVLVSTFSNSVSFAERFKPDSFDIVFLDIVMPQKNGLELAGGIYDADKNCQIVFVASTPDFAIQGYGVNAVSYLLKPVSRNIIASVLEKCLERRQKRSVRSLVVKIGQHTQKVDLAHTVYLESRNKQVLIHCDDDTVVCTGKLSDLLLRLPRDFVHIHKSYIVNLSRVKAMSRNEMVTDGDIRVPISRNFQKDAAKRYYASVAGEV